MHTHTTIIGLFSRTVWLSQQQKGIPFWILMSRWGCSGIRWTICKSLAPHSRQITKPAPHHN